MPLTVRTSIFIDVLRLPSRLLTTLMQDKHQTDEFDAYLGRLVDIVQMSLVPKIAFFSYLTDKPSDYNETLIETEPLLHYVHSSLHYEIVLTLFRLYDKRNSCRNIFHFLNWIEQNSKYIEWKINPTGSSIKAFKLALDAVEPEMALLIARRNKYFAHYDKKFFYDPSVMDIEYPFTHSNALTLVRLLQKIICHFSQARSGAVPLAIDDIVTISADNLFRFLRAHRGERFGR